MWREFPANLADSVGPAACFATNFVKPQQIQSEPLPDHPCVGESFIVRAKASSGLAVQASLVTGPATIVNNQVTCLRPGEVKIKLAQDGNDEFEAAPELVLTLTVNKAGQTIQFEPLPAEVFSGDRITIKPNASSRLPVDLRVVSGPAQVSGGRIAIITGPGPVEIEAHQSGNDKYLPVKSVLCFTALQRAQEIRFAELEDGRFEQPGFAFRANCSSGLPVTLQLVSGPGQVRGSDVFLNGGGPVVVKATQGGDRCYAPVETVHTFTPPKKRQRIDWEPVSGTIRVNETFTLKAVASSGLAVSFSVTLGNASLEDTRLTPSAAGTVVVKAYQAGNEDYEAAQAEQTFAVGKARQTLKFKALPKEVFVGDTIKLEVVASSGLTPVIFSVVSGRAEIAGDKLTATGAGSVTLKAIQSGDDRFEAAHAEESFIVLKAKQLIRFGTFPREGAVGECLVVQAIADSGLPVGFEVVSGPAEILDGRITLRGAGEVKVKAYQAGDEKFAPAPDAFVVIASVKGQQTIRFDLAREQLEVGESMILVAEASSGEPVGFRVVSGPAELKGKAVVGIGAGRVEIEAEQAGNERYLAARTQRTLLVHKRAQQIHCDPVPDRRFGEGPFVISATATSGLPVAFKVVSGPARIKDNEVTLVGAGRVEIKAHQPGNDVFAAADALIGFRAAKGSQSIRFAPTPAVVRVGETFVVEAEASSGLAVSLSVAQGTGTFEANRLSTEAAGTLMMRATQPGNDDYESAQAEQSVSVLKALQSLEFRNLPAELPIGETCKLEAVASSGLAVTKFEVRSGLASIAGNQLTADSPGRVVIKAVQEGDARFEPIEAEQALTVVRNRQTLRFELAREELQIGESVLLAAEAASGHPVVFRVLSGPVELTNGTLVATGIGVAEIEAEQAGTDNYLPVKLRRSVRITRRSQVIEMKGPADLNVGGGPFVLKAVASSGLAVAYSVASGPARINHNELTVLAAGQVSIKVSQPGNETYLPAERVFTFSAAKGKQTIRFEATPAAIRTGESLDIEATASSGLPIRFAIVEGKGQLEGTRLMASAAGNLTIKALQPGNENYEAAEAVRTFSVLKALQTLAFEDLPEQLHVGERCTLRAVASSGLAVTFAVESGAAVISGHDLLANGAGLVVLKALQPGNEAFEPAESSQSLEVLKAEQSIQFDVVPNEAGVGGSFPVSAKASSGLPVTIEVVSGPAEIVEGRLTVRGAGEVKLKARQLGNSSYYAAPEIVHAVIAVRARQTIRFDLNSDQIQVGDSIQLSAQATSGQPVVFRVLSGPGELQGNSLLAVGAGRVELEAEQVGNDQFERAVLRRSVSVVKRSQTIQIDPLPDRRFGEPSFTVRAIASSGLPVSIAVVSGPARMDGNQLALLGTGRVEIRASQNGTEEYAAAEALGNFTVAKGGQTVDFETIPDLTVGEDCLLHARASSGQTVSFRVKTGRAKLEDNRLTAGAVGTLVVEAVAAGSEDYEPAQALQTVEVLKAGQTIRFQALPAELKVGESCSLKAVASSGLTEVNFEIISGQAKIAGNQLTATGAGPVVIKAVQSGDERFEPAEATQSISIVKAKQSIRINQLPLELRVGESVPIGATASSELAVRIEVFSGRAEVSNGRLTALGAGEIKLKATQPGDETFAPAEEVIHTLTAVKSAQTLELDLAQDELQVGDFIELQAQASSGLPVTLRIQSGPGELNAGRLVATNAGTVEIEAEQKGDETHLPIKTKRVLRVIKRLQQIEFTELADSQLGEPGCVFSSAATSGLPVSLSVVSGQGRILEGNLILTGTGAVVVKAVQPGDARYAAAEAVRSFAPPKRRQKLEFDPVSGTVRVGQKVSLHAKASSGLPVSFSVISGQAAVVGDQLTPEIAGIVRLRATVGGNQDFEPAEAEQNVTVAKATQTLEFKSLPQEFCVGDTRRLEAVASSGLNNISLSVVSGAAQITGDQLTATGAGPLVIRAVEPGDGRFEAATAEQSLSIAKAKQTIEFDELPRQITAGQSVGIQARASSQLPVEIELVSGPAEILARQLKVRGAGEVKLKAIQPGDENFAPAPPVVQTVHGVKTPQTISFDLGRAEVRVGDSFTLAASASSGLPVTFRISAGSAQLNGNTLVATAAGQIEVEAAQAGDEAYLAVKDRCLLRAIKRSQEIVFEPIGPQKVGGPPVLLRATASSGLPVSFTVLSGPARINGNELTVLGTGRAEIKAKQEGNDTYSTAEAVSGVTVGKASQTIRFDSVTAPLIAGQPCTLRAVASSDLPISFQIVEGRATLNGNRLTPTVAGQLTIKAVQAGTEAYEAAEAVQRLDVIKATQTLRFNGLPKELSIGETCSLDAIASSGLGTFRFAVVSGRAAISGNELRASGAGPVIIKAIQPGNETFEAAEVEDSLTVVKSKQTIRFDELAGEVVAGELLPLRASSDSGLAVKIEVLSGPATIEADRLRLQGAGVVKIRATQAGDENYAPAAEIVQTLTASKARQTIRFDLACNELQIGESILLAATASSGQPIAFRLISGPAELAGDSLVGTGAGTVEIEAEVQGNNQYLPATARRSVRVVKRSQQIHLEALRNRKLSESPFGVGAKATSGLPVSIAVISGPASINGDEVTLTGGGKVRLLVTQPGDDRYESAPTLEAEFDAKQPRKPAIALVIGALSVVAVLVMIIVLFLPKNRSTTPSTTQTAPKPPEPVAPVVKVPTQAELAYAQDLSNSIALFHDGQLDAARQLIDKVLQEGPANTAVIGLKADIEEAIRVKDLQRDLQSAQQAESQAQWTNAIALLDQALLKANAVKDPKYRQSAATERSYATNILAAQTAFSQGHYGEAIHQADAALMAKNNDPVAGKIKADAQIGKDFQDALTAGRTALANGNFADALKQATAALRIRGNDPEAIALQKSALQEQGYQLAATAFKQGDYATALSLTQPFQGTNRFDLLTNQINQEQNQLKAMQTALSQGNYSTILQSSLPAKPAFDTLKSAAATENDALKQARQKLIAHDFAYFDALQRQTYAAKPPFVAVINEAQKAISEAQKAQEDAKAAQKTNATAVAAASTTSASALSVGQQDKLVEYWEIYFGLKPRPPGSDVKPVRDPTKDSAYNLEQFDKVEADYISAGALTADRKHRLNALRWVVSAGKKGEAPGFQK